MPHVLVVDDESAIRRILERLLKERGCTVDSVETGELALSSVRSRRPDFVLLDLHMEGMGGMETLDRLCRDTPGLPVVIMTGQGSIEVAVDAFKRGAADFVTKPFDEPKLVSTIASLLAMKAEAETASGPVLVGDSPAFRRVIDHALRFARPDINILLEAETGTGKELFARSIHAASKRKDGPFVPVDCSILSESLFESELFGHERGSFTGAVTSRIGHFERADKGTLFLDEIGNLPLTFQAKLLRVLQERTMERVGGRETIRLDIRVLSATNANLKHAVGAGTFRADLYYRLAEVTISPPPLRERVADIPLLAAHFVERYAAQYKLPVTGISKDAVDQLVAAAWPGNVRQLENVIKSAVVLADGIVRSEHLPADLGETERPRVSNESAGDRFRMEIELGPDVEPMDLKALANAASEKAERAVLETILRQGRYSHAQLAKMMNVDPKTLRAKLRKYGLDPGP
jgi:DNA-binding NtrC family response regulator